MDELENMSLNKFRLWSVGALKIFLSARKKPVTGDFEELSARAFCAWEEKVPSDYSALQAENRLVDEYKEKLRLPNHVLPDPFSLTNGWIGEDEGISKWPSIYITDIATYLNMRTPDEIIHRLINEYKEGKAYRYFVNGWVKEVKYHSICSNSTVCFLKGKVCPSQSLNNKPYDVWISVKKDSDSEPGGEILSGFCSCTAGMLGSCNHIAGLLFRIEHAVKTGVTKISSTSQRCTWNVPSNTTNFKPFKPACELVWDKGSYGKISMHNKEEAMKAKREFTPMTEQQFKSLKDFGNTRAEIHSLIKTDVSDSCFALLMEKRRDVKEPVVLPLSLIEIGDSVRSSVKTNDEEELRTVFLSKMTLTDDNIADINKATESQSSSDIWKKQRQGRVTASKFHRICSRVKTLKADKDADPSALVRSVMGVEEVYPSKAMKHGLSLEPNAKKSYKKIMQSVHKKFKCYNSGMCILKEYPFVSVSPDLVVDCICCGPGLCEIKCPESIKDKIPTVNNLAYLEDTTSGIQLKRNHDYFYQVQGQMGVTNRQYCDLFVFTFHGNLNLRVYFDRDFWESVLKDLIWFWKSFLLTDLLKGQPQHTDSSQINDGHSGVFSSPSYTHAAADSVTDTCNKHKACSTHTQVATLYPKKRRCVQQRTPVYLCGMCGGDISEKPECFEHQSVNCDSCNIWVHFECAGITQDKPLIENDEWLCNKCKQIQTEL